MFFAGLGFESAILLAEKTVVLYQVVNLRTAKVMIPSPPN